MLDNKKTEMKETLLNKEISILGLSNKVRFIGGYDDFMGVIYKNLKETGSTTMISCDDNEDDWLKINATIVKEGIEGYHDTMIKINNVEFI